MLSQPPYNLNPTEPVYIVQQTMARIPVADMFSLAGKTAIVTGGSVYP